MINSTFPSSGAVQCRGIQGSKVLGFLHTQDEELQRGDWMAGPDRGFCGADTGANNQVHLLRYLAPALPVWLIGGGGAFSAWFYIWPNYTDVTACPGRRNGPLEPAPRWI
ncbi:hypothetical protein KIL84_019944 [Mauremys mutica]|uniref:Uncharacterized protein n=1 Tax=Mauremys mutica TaxID=74926 RepID=A0A9D3XXW3_9SAUR|nr:hypothetical protein KIL84_019944 [Mauremys mutica]